MSGLEDSDLVLFTRDLINDLRGEIEDAIQIKDEGLTGREVVLTSRLKASQDPLPSPFRQPRLDRWKARFRGLASPDLKLTLSETMVIREELEYLRAFVDFTSELDLIADPAVRPGPRSSSSSATDESTAHANREQFSINIHRARFLCGRVAQSLVEIAERTNEILRADDSWVRDHPAEATTRAEVFEEFEYDSVVDQHTQWDLEALKDFLEASDKFFNQELPRFGYDFHGAKTKSLLKDQGFRGRIDQRLSAKVLQARATGTVYAVPIVEPIRRANKPLRFAVIEGVDETHVSVRQGLAFGTHGFLLPEVNRFAFYDFFSRHSLEFAKFLVLDHKTLSCNAGPFVEAALELTPALSWSQYERDSREVLHQILEPIELEPQEVHETKGLPLELYVELGGKVLDRVAETRGLQSVF